MFCLETDSCRAVSRCFTSAEPKTLSCARFLAQEKDRVLRALFFTIIANRVLSVETARLLGFFFLADGVPHNETQQKPVKSVKMKVQNGPGYCRCSHMSLPCATYNFGLLSGFIFRRGLLWCTRFRRVLGLENGPVKSNKSQKTLFGKDFPKPAKTQS